MATRSTFEWRDTVKKFAFGQDEIQRIRDSACAPNVECLCAYVKECVLVRIQMELGWSNIRAMKCRLNDRQTFRNRYNSDLHRDRHIVPQGPEQRRKELSLMNYSAVIYLDPAVFRFWPDSSVVNPTQDCLKLDCFIDVDIEPGEVILFPSSLIHQARPSSQYPHSRRRTIVIFDIENPDLDSYRVKMGFYHCILLCPEWTQMPLLHYVVSEQFIQQSAFGRLADNKPYHWRYIPVQKNIQDDVKVGFVHWQITSTHSHNKPSSDSWNRSVYLNFQYPPYVEVVDHRASGRYVAELVMASVRNQFSQNRIFGFIFVFSCLATIAVGVLR